MSETPPIKLYTALIAAQHEFGAIVKNRQNPHLKNYYADLGAVLDAVTEPLASHGLLIVQRFEGEGAAPVLITELIHAESGQRIASAVPVVSKDPTDPQKMGGAITYYRRYSLLALLGLAPEDDDGNDAAQPRAERSYPPQGRTLDEALNSGVSPVDPPRRRSAPPAPAQAVRTAPAPRVDLFTAEQYQRTMRRAWEIRREHNIEQAKGYLNQARPSMTKDQKADTMEELRLMEAWTPAEEG